MTRAASICSDFVLAGGPDARAWLRQLSGFRFDDDPQATVLVATKGEVQLGSSDSGRRWLALSDLVEGTPGAIADDDGFPQRGWRGRFAVASWQPMGNGLRASTDHFGSLPLYWYRRDGHFAVATDLRVLLGAPGIRRDVDTAAVYHYLNFGYIPAPLTICRDIRRVEPGTSLSLDPTTHGTTRYYVPAYPADLQGSDRQLAGELRDRIIQTVRDFRPEGDADWACFLSGGTDSSSITSILAQAGGGQVHTCSIGFHEAGYDELDFARLAGDACGARPHVAYVNRESGLELLEDVIRAYDQPFGNTSAIPTLACAGLGRSEGFSLMLGGDGGDEIFGGNQRYAKDKVLEAFHRIPRPFNTYARAVGDFVGGGDHHLLNRVRNFTQRGSLPNPDRFYTDDSFASDYYDELLSPEFRRHVGRDDSLEFMRGIYDEDCSADQLHRLMQLDLLMAIAQNDLVKVHRAGKHHGVAVRFPYLDPVLVDFCGRLPARHKVRRLKKRYLFKKAMAGILPDAILRKRKQGFGVPTAVWLKEDPPTQAMIRDVLLDERTRSRGWLDQDFIQRLIRLHMGGGWDHSTHIWQLLVLELWMRSYMDGT